MSGEIADCFRRNQGNTGEKQENPRSYSLLLSEIFPGKRTVVTGVETKGQKDSAKRDINRNNSGIYKKYP